MDKLYSWSAVRSGAAMTVTHSCGKLVNIVQIQPEAGVIVATKGDGSKFELCNPAPIAG